jgi:DNA-binding CsgD family transcriptional regulator
LSVTQRDSQANGVSAEDLTEAQRVALRLVRQGYESKEIGLQLGVSHYAINRRIERAVQALGARNRRDAARILAELESGTCERIAHEPLHLPSATESDTIEPPDTVGGRGFPWPFATPERHDGLTRRQRLFWALIGIPVIVMLAWGIFLSGVNALDSLGL